ncbi:arylamine N-acetyltransferase [Aquibium carbonis]|uniref:Arylamine N-acetyltransferase n=1 Tax=Aquibium carbonis TaxID=2495581 RepID=A0A3S0A926_9HYPH|nr:arylamine N-acetyltransferase [Aquibium carbonis]RST87468.1 arylamine N-acetyltransferase [Aquibium carbonis]
MRQTDDGPDLDAYFARIGYCGPRTATLGVLQELHLLHPRAIAFENLDSFLGRPVRLDLPSLEEKLVHARRGGYCFEQNTLFWKVLASLGFQVSGLAARVLWNQPDDTLNPRSHMLLRVELDGSTWLADVGFGGVTQTAPLRLAAGMVQRTPHEPCRLIETDDHHRLQVEIGGEWRTVFRFDLTEHFEVDYLVSSHFVSTWPASQFVTTIMAARALPQGRLALKNDRLIVHETGGASRHVHFATAADLRATLAADFGIDVPEPDRFDARFAELGFGQGES